MSVPIYKVDTMVIAVWNRDLNLTVCCYSMWKKSFCKRRRRSRLSKPKFPRLIDHNYCTSHIIWNIFVLIFVFSDVKTAITKWIQKFTLVVELNTLFLYRVRVTHNFCLFIIITIHDNHEVTRGGTTNTRRTPAP